MPRSSISDSGNYRGCDGARRRQRWLCFAGIAVARRHARWRWTGTTIAAVLAAGSCGWKPPRCSSTHRATCRAPVVSRRFAHPGLVLKPGRPNVVALVAASDGAVREIRQIGAIVPDHMSLSPDGRYIAYDAPDQPGAADRDIYVLDAHTGNQWHARRRRRARTTAPFWSPDGRALVFLSDRNRNPSLWMVAVDNGRPQGPPRLLKDDVGRAWSARLLSGRCAALSAVRRLRGSLCGVNRWVGAAAPEPLSPRRAVSNFYPVWSTDGRFVAYASERGGVGRGGGGRELWVYDTATDSERMVPVDDPIGLPYAWSSDSEQILVARPNNSGLLVVDRSTGRRGS